MFAEIVEAEVAETGNWLPPTGRRLYNCLNMELTLRVFD
jgi:hypothetical protein